VICLDAPRRTRPLFGIWLLTAGLVGDRIPNKDRRASSSESLRSKTGDCAAVRIKDRRSLDLSQQHILSFRVY
jgi:hypothetical protein